MAEFFIWTVPSFVTVIQAGSEQDAAEKFLELPVKVTPEVGIPPHCYVQPTRGRATPHMDGSPTPFWIDLDDEDLQQ